MSRISSRGSGERLNWSQVYLGVGLTTLATLILELALTRIFSVVFYYHFAFLAISIALFGLGAGGVLSYAIARGGNNVFARLGVVAASTSVVVALSLAFVLSRQDASSLTLALIYFACALPFVLAGAVVSLAISETIERVDRVYFADLIGAAIGCLLLVPFLNSLGGPNTVLAAAVLFAASSSIWFNLGGRATGRIGGVALALALVALITVNMRHRWIDVKFAKGAELVNETFVKWNSFSRIAVRPDAGGNPEILIDADASTGIANFDFANLSERQKRDLMQQGPAFPYRLLPGGKTLIIGPGGGWDVARAIATGSRDITGVEINPIIARTIMQEHFPQYSRNLYSRPEVRIVVEDGRSFVRRSGERYDILQATLVDTWASTAAGAFSLSENNLYTVEAFHDYLSHLTDRGVLAFTRWGFDPPRESLRLISLARTALDRLGERDHPRHFIVVREGGSRELAGWGTRDTVIISRKPLPADVLASARAATADSGMTAVYMPDRQITNEFTRLLHSADPERFRREYRYDISPVTDDRPFFFYTVQPRDLLSFLNPAAADYKINKAVPMLFTVLGVSILATAVILLLPPLVLRNQLPREPGVLGFLLYFLCIGAGYILIQVALIQKFVLFLGHPTYALTVIIFSMLVFSSLGSFFSRTALRGSDVRLMTVLAGVAAAVSLVAGITSGLAEAAISWPLGLKVLVSVLLIGPAAFLMGMPFPTGLARLERWHSEAVRWAWALNAASSVLGSAAAIFLAIYIGLRNTVLVGGLLYLCALWVWHVHRRYFARQSSHIPEAKVTG